MRKLFVISTVSLFIFLTVMLETSFGIEVTLFGPRQYERVGSSPDMSTNGFAALPGTGKLIIKNGTPTGSNRIEDAINSAVIKINDEVIFGPSDLNQNVGHLEADIDLLESNTLFVELMSKPDTFITVTVTEDVPPPTVTISADKAEIFKGGVATLSWTSTTADTCRIEPAVGAVDASGFHDVSPNETTTYTITATGLGGTATDQTTVALANRPPVAGSQTVTAYEDTPVAITLTGSDPDEDPLVFHLTSGPSNGAVSDTPPNLVYTPDTNYFGEDTLTFSITDGKVESAPATVAITVAAVNDPPTAAAGADQSVNSGDTVALDGSGSSDPDGDPLTYKWSFASMPSGSHATLSDPTAVRPTFVTDAVGIYEVRLAVNDGTVISAADAIIISVTSRMVTVPNVLGLLQGEAEVRINTAGLALGSVTSDDSDTVPADHVIEQSPGAGVSAEEGSSVNLVVSLGNGANKPPAAVFSASPSSIAWGDTATLFWTSQNGQSAFIDNGVGVIPLEGSASVSPDHTTVYTITVTGPTGSSSAQVTVSVTGEPAPQPKGSFGEQYQQLVPPDATITEYDDRRFSLVTGKVNGIDSSPIAGVAVHILEHPEYGTVYTDTDGLFTLPVEGGGTLTVEFRNECLITAHRKLYVPWNDIAVVETVQLIEQDPVSTTVIFDGSPSTVAVHQSSLVTDEFGSRFTTLVFTGNNRAYLVDEAGNDVHELTTITTRATDFTTRESMPAGLPPNSAYTYCVELSVDGVSEVRFDKPIVTWVDNFLGFDVGEMVPVGHYDRHRGVWVPSENGVVVKLLDTNSDGVVDALDSDGDDQPNDLNNNTSFSDEVKGLEESTLYKPGATYWRVEITHFTPWDCNWPFGPPPDAVAPNPIGEVSIDQRCMENKDCKRETGSYVEDRSRIFHEDIHIPGTQLALNYSSERVRGYQIPITIPASGEYIPSSLKKILVEVEVGGKTLKQALEPLPYQQANFVWDGMDHLGNPVVGPVSAHFRVGFVYDAYYYTAGNFTQSFAQAGRLITAVRAKQEIISWKTGKKKISSLKKLSGIIAEGWTVSTHHHMFPADPSTIHKGDGSSSINSSVIIETIAGDGETAYDGEVGLAIEKSLGSPIDVAIDSKGNLYIADYSNRRIRMVDKNGIMSTAVDLSWMVKYNLYPNTFFTSIALDKNDVLYYSLSSIKEYNAVFKIEKTTGYPKLVAGGVGEGFSGDGGPAVDAKLYDPKRIAIDPNGNLYIADRGNYRIRKVDSNGIITTIAGNGLSGHDGDGGPAIEARLYYPLDILVDDTGCLYIGDVNWVRKVDTSGIITTIVGNLMGTRTEGVPATEASLSIGNIAFDKKGILHLVGPQKIFKINESGNIKRVAGVSSFGFDGDGGSPKIAQLNRPRGIIIDQFDNIYVADTINNRVRKIGPPAVFRNVVSSEEIPFAEKTGVGHIMSKTGLHLRTIALETGIVLREFAYDLDDHLVSITDQFGNVTSIQRDGYGVPTAIVSPDGLITALIVDENNFLTRITYPDGSHHDFEYNSGGLLTAKIEPNGNQFDHYFDDSGKLIEVFDQEGGSWRYTKTVLETGDIFTEVTSAEDNRTSYLDHINPQGVYTSTITDPSGAETLYSESSDGLNVTKTLPCGLNLVLTYDIDSEYKFKVVKEMTERMPSGLARITQMGKTYEDTDSDTIPDLMTKTVTINGRSASIVNNTLQSRKTAITPGGRTITTYYNSANLLAESVSIPGLEETNYIYDSRGRLISVITGNRQRIFSYNAQGFLESVTGPKNDTTAYSHDSLGRITDIMRPDGSHLGFTYDENGNTIVLTNPLDVNHGFGFNKVNRSSGYVTPMSGRYAYFYDRDRRLVRTVFPSGQQIVNMYQNGRLIQTQSPEGFTNFAYLCGTKVDTVSKNGEGITYGYDGDLVVSEVLSGTLGQTIGYTYNNDFKVSSSTYAGGTMNYTYDEDNLLIGSGAYAIARDPDNGLPETVSGNGFKQIRIFNGYGEVDIQDTAVGGVTVGSWSVTRDNSGRIVGRTENTGRITHTYSYTYDEVGRLLTVTRDGVLVEEYDYNANGMCIYDMNSLRGIAGRIYDYDAEDRLLTAGGTSYSFDLDGFLSSKTEGTDVTIYDYSSRGELLGVSLPDGRVVHYVHDPMGRRIAKMVDGLVVEKYLWQGLTKLLSVFDGADNLIQRFEYADERMPVAMTMGGSRYFFSYDQVGSLRAVVDGAGNVLKLIEYDSFGNVIADSDPTLKVPFGFAGGLHDRDTGLVRFGHRDYDPNIGRWTAKDPIFFAGGDSDLYGYVLNDPINAVDPFGLDATDLINTFGGRSVWDGPTNGNWGGKCWSGGQYSCGPAGGMGNAPPADSGDECYQRHDNCYSACGSNNPQCGSNCDQQLVKDLRGISDNPLNWPRPPRPGTEGDSRRFRDWAIWYFN